MFRSWSFRSPNGGFGPQRVLSIVVDFRRWYVGFEVYGRPGGAIAGLIPPGLSGAIAIGPLRVSTYRVCIDYRDA